VSPSWGRTTKQWIVAIWLIVGALAIYTLWNLVLPLALAVLLAYMMNPLVDGIVARFRLPRLLVTALVYLVLVVLISLAPILIVPEGFIQPISRAQLDLNKILLSLRDSIASYGTLRVAGYVVDPTQVYQLVLDNLQASLSQVAPRSVNVFFGVATGFATTVLWLILILVVSFYLVKDSPSILDYIDSQLPPPYRDEVWNLIYTIGDVWNAFLRGQLLLGSVIGVTVGVSMFVLGVSNAAVLGLIAGILEIVPNLGPIISMIPAILIALFQGSSHLPISNGWFVLIVLGTYTLIQQIENNVLVPRIIGGSVDLHPVVVLVGAVAGASIGGILGIFLAAPTLATVRVLAGYAYGKLLAPGEEEIEKQGAANVEHPPDDEHETMNENPAQGETAREP